MFKITIYNNIIFNLNTNIIYIFSYIYYEFDNDIAYFFLFYLYKIICYTQKLKT